MILADESAEWKIAGLRQLDRLVFALNQLVESTPSNPAIDIVVLWRPDIAAAARWLPRDPRIKRVRVGEDPSLLQPGVRVLTSRLFVDRNGLREHLNAIPAVRLTESMVDPRNSWRQLNEQFEISCDNSVRSSSGVGWKYLKRADDIHGSENILLRRAGKSQDGIVSRFVNRPLLRDPPAPGNNTGVSNGFFMQPKMIETLNEAGLQM